MRCVPCMVTHVEIRTVVFFFIALVAQRYLVTLLTGWDVSSIPANGIFLTKNNYKTKIKMPNAWRTIKSLVHKSRLHGRRGKGMAESFPREKLRHAPQKGGWEILCDLPPVWPRLVCPTNVMSRKNGKKTHTHTHTHTLWSLRCTDSAVLEPLSFSASSRISAVALQILLFHMEDVQLMKEKSERT